jgi:hypothetical protein
LGSWALESVVPCRFNIGYGVRGRDAPG